jgi:hypothetical protein
MKPVKTPTHLKPILVPLSALAILMLTACTTQESGAPEDVSKTVKTAEATQTGPDADVIQNYGGDGMKIPLDGTSLAAFDASMEKIKRNTEPKSYKTLSNAIDYLLVYDIGAKGNKEALAAKLNGLNGYDVLSKVGWRRAAPGKGDAEIGAADAKIDT